MCSGCPFPCPAYNDILLLTVLAQQSVGETQLPGSCLGVAPTVARQQLLLSIGFGLLGPVVSKPTSTVEQPTETAHNIGHRLEQVPDGVEELRLRGEEGDGKEEGKSYETHGDPGRTEEREVS